MPRIGPHDYYQPGDRKTPVKSLFAMSRQMERMKHRLMWLSVILLAIALGELAFGWWVVHSLSQPMP